MGHAQDPDHPSPPSNPAIAARFLRASTDANVRVVALTLPPELDSEEFDHLNAALLAEVGTIGIGGACVLDLSSVEYMGSAMLGLMVNARQRIKAAGGRLVLCGMSPWLVQTFRTCCLERLFVTAVSRPDAMKVAGRK